MSATLVSYLVFTIALIVSVSIDVLAMRKANGSLTLRGALVQFGAWFSIAIAYGVFLYFEFDRDVNHFTTYLSAYLVEESLSVDNIFVFILLFKNFKVPEHKTGQLLLIGILIAIVLRLIFIVAGIAIVERFSWILYLFGGILLYSGFKLFFNKEKDEAEEDPKKGKLYQIVTKLFRVHYDDADTTFTKMVNGKKYFTRLFLVVIILGATDIVFAIDSIPAVLSISQDKLIVLSSNVFAVLGLRALFFILRIAADKFDYLQQGIAVVLIFIGVKLLLGLFNIHIAEWISLCFIVLSLGLSMLFSYFYNKEAA
jgi:tellurite resistance protein TerC